MSDTETIYPVAAEPEVSPTPVARPSTRDFLKKKRILEEVVDIGDDYKVLVKGLSGNTALDMYDDFEDPDEITAKEANPVLLRNTVFDLETGENIYDDTWTDEEINEQPIDVINKLVAAANRVLGRTSETGKD